MALHMRVASESSIGYTLYHKQKRVARGRSWRGAADSEVFGDRSASRVVQFRGVIADFGRIGGFSGEWIEETPEGSIDT